ncbi:MAG: clan AA aspartic protease [Gammaproteobacteria bacterium]|nr:clan AA aspartic protease [Gammaproteobacteria bacterium]MDE0432663.1 clan AA aspartic protease [Bryobacterales bacterium]
MTAGVVNSAYEAVVTLSLQSPAGQSREIETVVDTGFTGYLTLPPALVRDLALPYVTSGWATLADGSEVSFDTYQVTVLWEGQPKEVFADEADTTPLIGMLLMDGCDLSIHVRNGGRVLIQANAPQS